MRLRHLSALAAVGLFAAFGPSERTAPTRWALLVGISDYTHFGDEIGGDLPGAANDARSWRDVLVARWGFPEENVRMLLDGEATRAGIEAALTGWLRSSVRPGDAVVFMYAGHGSQKWDESGDEEDGLDETICPADVLRGDTSHDIGDDEIGGWLNAIPTDNLVVIWDKCHAESSTRAAVPFARPRSLDRDVARDVAKPAGADEARPLAAGESTADGRRKQILELSASQSDEVAMDVAWPQEDGGFVHGGAFSTFMVRNLWNVPVGTSYRELFERARADLKRERFAQTPAISAEAAERPAFLPAAEAAYAAAPAEPGRESRLGAGVPVAAVEGRDVRLGAGAAAGVTRGSVYRVGPALIRVTAVDAGGAEALVASSDAGKVRRGARASLVAFRAPEAELSVSVAELSAEQRAALAAELGGAAGVRLVEEAGGFAHLIVRPRGSDLVVYGLDGAERHVVGAGELARLAALLAAEQGAQALAELENPARPFALELSMSGGKTRFGVGEEVGFRVRSERAGYLTLVDLGTDGRVRVIYPNAFVQDNRVGAGEEVLFPTAAMTRDGIVFQAEPPVGRGIVRAFVTERPLELPFAEGSASQAAEVGAALRAALGPAPLPGDALPVAGWATASVVYEIVK